jgi:DNA (cytosine-5)-methyltransferase 1
MRSVEAVDLFCGVGGLSYGLKQAKINVLAGVDLDPNSKYPFERNINAEFIQKSVTELKGEDIRKFYSPDSLKLLAGCAPCQPFSTYSQGPRGKDDDQWKLLLEFGRLVEEVRPDLVTMENVPALHTHEVFKNFTDNLRGLGYFIHHKVVDCQQYGLAQTRKRLVLVGSRFGDIDLIPPTGKVKTVRQVLKDVPPQSAGEVDINDPFHRSAKLSELNFERIKVSKPGGTWKDWPKELIANCHKKDSGRSYPAVYGRMEWDKPAPTMTTQYFGYGNGRFGHPEQDRALSLREGAILQGFPARYKFVPPDGEIYFKKVGRLVGNAVPPPLGKLIGKSFLKHLDHLQMLN